MADFTTGVIDLSIENTFDNVIMGATDTMTFSNSGTGGAANAPISVTGNFTVAAGAVITLRNNANLTPGTVTVVGITRDLDAAAVVPGTQGAGGQGYFTAGDGGAGGATESSGVKGDDGDQTSEQWIAPVGGAGGVFSGGTGSKGGVADAASNDPQGTAAGGGGGASGTNGKSTESVSFYVLGTISITGGTITGVGGAAVDNGGAGGDGGNGISSTSYEYSGGGGGGGAGAGGGNAGSLFLYHIGSAAEAFDTTTLTGGAATNGGAGGLAGTSPTGKVGTAGTAGTNGSTGAAGIVELIDVDTTPLLTATAATEIFSRQATLSSEVTNDGGQTITERGFVYSESINPVI